MSPKDVYVLMPRTCEDVMVQSGIKGADGIRVADQMTLRWGTSAGLCWQIQRKYKGPYTRRQENLRRTGKCDGRHRGWKDML